MDGGNLAARSVEIAVSVKLRARGGWPTAAAQVRCGAAGVVPCESASNYSGLMLSVALCIADIDRGRRRFVSIRTSGSVFASSRWCRAHFGMRLRARGHPQVVGKVG